MSTPLSKSTLLACFSDNYQQLIQFFRHRTGSAEDARELTQDLWLALRRRDNGSDEVGVPEALLFTIARNMAVDHVRHNRLAGDYAEAYLALNVDEPAVADTVQQVAARKVLERLQASLMALPERTREVFMAYRVQGLGHDELAARYGVTRSTIERDLARAARAAQAVLDAWHASAESRAGHPGALVGSSRRRLVGTLLGWGAATGGLGLAYRWWQAQVQQWQLTMATVTGRRLQREMPDGTRVTLDAESRAEIAYSASRRQVRLDDGAAFFEVVHEPARPFVVDARDIRVTVLGTRFSVDIERPSVPSQAQDRSVEVGVESGRVQVSSASGAWAPVALTAGQRGRFRNGHAPRLETLDDPALAAAWRKGWLVFRDATLGEVITRLRRYTEANIVIGPLAAAVPITAEIDIDRAVQWIKLLPRVVPVRVSVEPLSAGGAPVITVSSRDES